MIHFDNVSKDYGHDQWALQNINFKMLAGEMCFLTGHSGAGKSTLLKAIMALTSITEGKLLVNGFDLNHIKRKQIPQLRLQIGCIFQDPQLIKQRTIYENVALPLIIHGLRYPEMVKRVRPALEMVGLLDKERAYPAALSCGEQQRVGIARAIVTKPKVILADEPTGNLDPELSLEIMKLFHKLNQVGVTVLIATHDIGLIRALPHRMITLDHGHIADDHHA